MKTNDEEIKRILEEQKKRKDWINNGHCPLCGTPVKSKGICPDCQKKREKKPQTPEERNRKKRERGRKLRSYRIKNHLCTGCGYPLPEGYGYQTCDVCRGQRNKSLKHRYILLKAQNKCVNCGVKKENDGHALCKQCRIKRREEKRKKSKDKRLTQSVTTCNDTTCRYHCEGRCTHYYDKRKPITGGIDLERVPGAPPGTLFCFSREEKDV